HRAPRGRREDHREGSRTAACRALELVTITRSSTHSFALGGDSFANASTPLSSGGDSSRDAARTPPPALRRFPRAPESFRRREFSVASPGESPRTRRRSSCSQGDGEAAPFATAPATFLGCRKERTLLRKFSRGEAAERLGQRNERAVP